MEVPKQQMVNVFANSPGLLKQTWAAQVGKLYTEFNVDFQDFFVSTIRESVIKVAPFFKKSDGFRCGWFFQTSGFKKETVKEI